MGPSKLEDKPVGPAVERDEEIVETGPDVGELRLETNVGGGAVVVFEIVVGTLVGIELDSVDTVEVDDAGEVVEPDIPTLERDEARVVDVEELSEGRVAVDDVSVLSD